MSMLTAISWLLSNSILFNKTVPLKYILL